MEWNFDKVKYNGKDLDRVQVDGVTVWEKKKVVYYEYCANTTTTRLDTGIIANNNTRLEFKLWGNVTDSFYSMGTRINATGSQLFSLTGSRNNQSVMFSVGYVSTSLQNLTRTANGYTYSGWYQTNGDMTYSYYLKDEGTNTEYNGSNISYTQSLADNNLHIFLFSNGFNDILAQLRLYYVRIYQDGVLVRDFRPAKVNNVIGLYDEVSGQLFTADNLAVGGEIKYYDYLENKSTAYIETNYFPNQDTKIEISYYYKGVGGTGLSHAIILGCCDATPSMSDAKHGLLRIQGGVNRVGFGNGDGTTVDISGYNDINRLYTVLFDNNKAYINNQIVATFPTSTWIANYSLWLFGRNTAGELGFPCKAKLYYCKIWENDTLVRDYKPCLYNNQAGLWDSIECKFYGNANNTGTLTVGNDE